MACQSQADSPATTERAAQSASAALTPPPPAVLVGSVNVPSGGANLSLGIYDSSGQLVRTLKEAEPTAAGSAAISWDGQDDFHNTLPGGSYSWRALTTTASAVDEGSIAQRGTPTSGVEVNSAGIQVVAVDPSGNIYEASVWEEFHQELRSWTSSGARRWGAAISALGGALAVDESYVYAAMNVDGENRIQRYPSSPSSDNVTPVPWSGQTVTGYIRANASGGHQVFGLDVDDSRLWVSNRGTNSIAIYDKTSGALLSQFSVTDPHGLAADDAGHVWVAQGTSSVVEYDVNGTTLAQITGLSGPFAVAVGGPSNHVYIAEAATGRVKEYLPSTQALVRTLFGKALPGPVHDDRLRWPDTVDPECTTGLCVYGAGGGLAVDSTGRIIIADYGNQRVQVYNADGTLAQSRFNGYANAPQVDPNVNPNLVLSGGLEYSVDHSNAVTHGNWSLANNWTPNGASARTSFSGATSHRKLSNGREYIYAFVGQSVYVHQIASDGQSARLSAVIGNSGSALSNAADTNANGTIESGEVSNKAGTAPYTTFAPGLWIDVAGNLFIANGTGNSLQKLPLEGFDAQANPLYDWTHLVTVAAGDSTFWHFAPTNIRVDPVNGDVYRIGNTTQASSNPFWMGGTTIERRTTTGRSLFYIKPTISTDPTFVPAGLVATATDTDGNYFYAGISGSIPNAGQVAVKMYTTDGLLVTSGDVGATNGTATGWIDGGFGLSAFTVDGTHYVYTEDSFYGRAIRFRINDLGTLQRDPGATFTWTPSASPQIITVEASVPDAIEGATSAPGVLTFTRTDSRGDLTVNFTTSGTATSGADYVLGNSSAHFANGQFSTTVSVGVVADTVADGNETVVLTLAAGDGYATGTPSAATVTLHDQTVLTVSASPATINVANQSATYVVTRSNTDLPQTVNYTLGPPFVQIATATASSVTYATTSANAVTDGSVATSWMTSGNATNSGTDDEPWIRFDFAAVHALGTMRVNNFNGGEGQRAAKDIDVFTSTDGTTFTLFGSRQLRPGSTDLAAAQWQEVDLGGIQAKSVKLAIRTNHANVVFYHGTSFEGAWANNSITGLSEVQFYEPGASPSDIAAIAGNKTGGHFSTGTLAFAAGQSTASVTVTSVDRNLVNQPPKPLELRLLGNGTFTVGTPGTASVTILNDRLGPVVSLAAELPSAVRGGAAGKFRFTRQGDLSSPLTVTYGSGLTPLVVASTGASSSYGAATPNNTTDGRADTFWMSAGNSQNEGKDYTPWISFAFPQVQSIGGFRVRNFSNLEAGRGARNVEVLVSTDGSTFSSIGTKVFNVGTSDPANVQWQDIDLFNVPARIVKLAIHDNHYNWNFYQSPALEGPWANASITGLSDVDFLGGSTATITEFAPGTLTGSVVIPAGQSYVDLPINALASATPGHLLTLAVTSNDTAYTVGSSRSASVTIVDEVFATPVPIVSSSASSSYSWMTPTSASYDGDLSTPWMTSGNSDHEGHDDTPWIIYNFDQVRTLGTLRLSNFNSGENGRGAKDVELFVSTDGSTFTSIGTRQFPRGASSNTTGTWQDVALGGVRAGAVKIVIHTDWFGTTFYQNSSYEGAWANASITGLSEIQFYAALPIASSSASSSYDYRWPATASYDGDTTTLWFTAGNAPNEGRDYQPWIQYTFDQVYSLGLMQVSNYNGGEYWRGPKDVEVFVSQDGTSFSSLGYQLFTLGSPTTTGGTWQAFDLQGVPAKAVKLAIHTNYYGRTFYDSPDLEIPWANGSITGLSEVQFYAPRH